MPISFDHCSFSYRSSGPVLRDFALVFPAGRTVLLGPNGAGKSTLLGLAASLLRPAEGSVRYGPLDPARRRDRSAYRRRVGWLPQQVKAIPGMRVREQVAYAAWLKGVSRVAAWERALTVLDRVGLRDLAGRDAAELSGGQLRRVGLAQTLAHDAEVILMDEPTAGLDPIQRSVFRDLVISLGEQVSIVVSTHQTEDLSEAYENVIVLDKGQVRFSGPVTGFLALAPDAGSGERSAEAAYGRLIASEV